MSVTLEQIEKGAILIYTCLDSAIREKKGCCIGRNGSTELTTLFMYETQRICDSQMAKNLERYSGIFPATPEILRTWIDSYKKTLQTVSDEPFVTGWFQGLAPFEQILLKQLCPNAKPIPLRCLEPYYVAPEKRWTVLLAEKRVAVVSSFAKSIQAQCKRGKEIWGEHFETLLPSTTTWIPIQTGFPPEIARGRLEWSEGCTTWKEALDWLEQEVLKQNVDVCLIGCGALGMMLAARLKKQGIACIVMGGAIQVLFGIKGQRWQHHSIIANFWNNAWVWPSEEETPRASGKIEGGCYWNPST